MTLLSLCCYWLILGHGQSTVTGYDDHIRLSWLFPWVQWACERGKCPENLNTKKENGLNKKCEGKRENSRKYAMNRKPIETFNYNAIIVRLENYSRNWFK